MKQELVSKIGLEIRIYCEGNIVLEGILKRVYMKDFLEIDVKGLNPGDGNLFHLSRPISHTVYLSKIIAFYEKK